MRVLMLSQGYTIDDQPSYHKAFLNARSCGAPVDFKNIPFMGYVKDNGWDALWREICLINDQWRPDLIYFQFFHGLDTQSPCDCIACLRASRNVPLIFGSLGDLFQTSPYLFYRPPPRGLLDLASWADAFFSTSMGDFSAYLVAHGAKNVIFLPHAHSDGHFGDTGVDAQSPCKYDVVMLGSINYDCSVKGFGRMAFDFMRKPLRTLSCCVHSGRRIKTVDILRRRYGDKFGLFGRGWDRAYINGPVPFREQLRVFRSGRIVLDAIPPFDQMYYASDRPFFIAGSGSPMVMFSSPRFDRVLRPEEHVYFATGYEDLVDVCDKILNAPDEELRAKAQDTAHYIRERHMASNRVDTILSVAEALKAIRSEEWSHERGLESLRLWHFLPEVDLNEERRYAIANWRG